jgi:DNA-directed RNA polymerase subunit RPC12/RpoP
MTISEKVAYLKGLAEGLKLDPEESKEAKLLSVMMDILENIGLSIADLEENALALGDEIDALSDDLSDVEEIVYDEEYDDCDCDDDDCCCHDHDDLDEDFFEMECPSCGEALVIDESVMEQGSITCPSCGQKFVLETGDDGCEEDGGCGCGCGCGE